MDVAGAERWLQAYGRAWEEGDADGVVALFSADATYRSYIFGEPNQGHDGIHDYWRRVTSTQDEVEVRMGDPLVDRDWVVAEWWTTMRDLDDGRDVTLPGVVLLRFSDDRCTSLWEYWNVADGRHEPFKGWGLFDRTASGDVVEHARRWADAWESGWRSLDVQQVASLYGAEAEFRSHPFRAPARGPAGAADYARRAFDEEASPHPRFGTALASGSSAAVEYWATLEEGGEEVTIAGCALVSFDAQGLVAKQRDYWHIEPGHSAPPPAWGRH